MLFARAGQDAQRHRLVERAVVDASRPRRGRGTAASIASARRVSAAWRPSGPSAAQAGKARRAAATAASTSARAAGARRRPASSRPSRSGCAPRTSRRTRRGAPSMRCSVGTSTPSTVRRPCGRLLSLDSRVSTTRRSRSREGRLLGGVQAGAQRGLAGVEAREHALDQRAAGGGERQRGTSRRSRSWPARSTSPRRSSVSADAADRRAGDAHRGRQRAGLHRRPTPRG